MKATTTITTKQVVNILPKVQRQLMTELNGYATMAAEMKGLDSAKKAHSTSVLDIALAHIDAEKFELNGYKVAVVKGALDRRLDKDAVVKRLVKDGTYSLKAAMALMEDCTTEKPKKDHCRITCPGEDERNT